MVLWFVCVNLRDLRETLGFLLCILIEYSCVYSPADSADPAEECSRAALYRRERQIGEVKAVLRFCGLSAIICVICGRIGRSHIQKTMSMNIKNNNNGRSHGNKGN